MRNCFVPTCDQKCKYLSKRMMFMAPKDKDILEKWINVLPKLRPFKKHDKVCDRHFREEDIITTYDHVIKGEMFQFERGRAKLKPNAIPCLNIPSDEELKVALKSKSRKRTLQVKQIAKKVPLKLTQPPRESLIRMEIQATVDVEVADHKQQQEQEELERAQPQQENQECEHLIPAEKTHQQLNEHSEEQEEIQEYEQHILTESELPLTEKTNQQHNVEISENQIEEEFEKVGIEIVQDYTDERIQEIFNSLYDDIYEVVLPNTLWGVHRCTERTMIFFSYIDPQLMRTTKMISISTSGSVKFCVANRIINELSLAIEISSAEVLSEVIAQADEMHICSKVFQSSFCEVEATAESAFCKFCKNNAQK